MTTLKGEPRNQTTEGGDTLLTTREVAELLNVHPNTVRTWSKMGLLPFYRIGTRGDRRFKLTDVEDFLRKRH